MKFKDFSSVCHGAKLVNSLLGTTKKEKDLNLYIYTIAKAGAESSRVWNPGDSFLSLVCHSPT